MKFTHSLKFNAVPEWRDHYLAYAALKKIIYAITSAEYHAGYEGEGNHAASPVGKCIFAMPDHAAVHAA